VAGASSGAALDFLRIAAGGMRGGMSPAALFVSVQGRGRVSPMARAQLLAGAPVAEDLGEVDAVDRNGLVDVGAAGARG
jgi:hypothetical protein